MSIATWFFSEISVAGEQTLGTFKQVHSVGSGITLALEGDAFPKSILVSFGGCEGQIVQVRFSVSSRLISDSITMESSSLVDGGVWVHLAITYDFNAGNLTFYVDGDPKEWASVLPFSASTGDQLKLGECECSIADFQIHETVLPGEQIMKIYSRAFEEKLVPPRDIGEHNYLP